MKQELPKVYRVIAQTESLTMTAEMSREMLAAEVAEFARKKLLSSKGDNREFVVLPIASERAYKNGHISFCPRCGTNIAEEMGDDKDGIANNDDQFTCDDCNAEITVYIHVREEEVEEGDTEV